MLGYESTLSRDMIHALVYNSTVYNSHPKRFGAETAMCPNHITLIHLHAVGIPTAGIPIGIP